MANRQKVRMNRLEKKYSGKIAKLLKEYKDRQIGELWVELDKLKEEMRVELDAIQGHNMD